MIVVVRPAAVSVTSPPAVSDRSPAALMVSEPSAAFSVMALPRPPSLMTTSPPDFVSSKVMVWPDRLLMTRVLFEPSVLVAGGGWSAFHRPPMTYGLLRSPCSNATSTWSPGSGRA